MTDKNIWVAAGDGDLERVQELIERQSMSPNVPDPFSYTPMHAAASYGQICILEYLLSHGGDVNVTDSDGDTPLYTVENVETARFLVEHGAVVARQNLEGVSPIDHLMDDFPEVAEFLRCKIGETSSLRSASHITQRQPSQHSQNATSEELTTNLMSQVQQIVADAEAEGRDVNTEELRSVVGQSVLDGILAGYQMTATNADDSDVQPAKRTRLDDNEDGSTGFQ